MIEESKSRNEVQKWVEIWERLKAGTGHKPSVTISNAAPALAKVEGIILGMSRVLGDIDTINAHPEAGGNIKKLLSKTIKQGE